MFTLSLTLLRTSFSSLSGGGGVDKCWDSAGDALSLSHRGAEVVAMDRAEKLQLLQPAARC